MEPVLKVEPCTRCASCPECGAQEEVGLTHSPTVAAWNVVCAHDHTRQEGERSESLGVWVPYGSSVPGIPTSDNAKSLAIDIWNCDGWRGGGLPNVDMIYGAFLPTRKPGKDAWVFLQPRSSPGLILARWDEGMNRWMSGEARASLEDREVREWLRVEPKP